MANVVVKIDGEQETVKALNMFDMDKKSRVMKTVRKHAVGIRKDARNKVAVSPSDRKKKKGSPGDLKNSIRNKYYFNGLGAMVIPEKGKGWYRGIVEKGTKDRTKGRFRGRVKPAPFMEPAKRSREASYTREMENIFGGDTTI